MDQLIICTVGLSIAQKCPAREELLKQKNDWDSDVEILRSQIKDFLNRDENSTKNPETRGIISAEVNSLNKLGVNKNDRVILLSSDDALCRVCADMNKKAIMESFGLSDDQVTIRRIEGLQVQSGKILREKGLTNLVKVVVDEYLENENIRYSYDIVLNPTGGYKGVVSFLTVLGMLYGRRTIYIFEHAKELINLPPLPFSFDVDLFDRVRPALLFVEKEIAVTEEAFLSKIKYYTPEERDRFMAFTEPLDSKLTLSPLAHSLISMENRQEKPVIAPSAVDTLEKIDGASALMVRRIIKNSVDSLWRSQKYHSFSNTDLIVLKPGRVGPRIAGFFRNKKFHITHVFGSHDDYERTLGKSSKKDFDKVDFIEWEETEDLGVDSDDRDELLMERDKLLLKTKEMETKIALNKKTIDDKDLEIMELSDKTDKTEKLLKKLKLRLAKKQSVKKIWKSWNHPIKRIR